MTFKSYNHYYDDKAWISPDFQLIIRTESEGIYRLLPSNMDASSRFFNMFSVVIGTEEVIQDAINQYYE